MKRTVAVKLLPSDRSSPAEVARFLQEASALARLSHSNIVSVYDLTYHEGRLAIVLEYVSGRTLAEQLRHGSLSESEATHVVCMIAEALEHAHRRGVVHRDLKPSNVLLRWPEPLTGQADSMESVEIKVSDFGLAKMLDGPRETLTGQRLGTPAYMAPEQVSGDVDAVGFGTDLYGLGAILYELLTGQPPFTASDPLVIMSMIRQNEPTSPKVLNPRLSIEICLICLKCLAKLPENRYSSAAALIEDLQDLRAGRPISVKPTGLLKSCLRWTTRNRTVASSVGIAVLSIAALIQQSVDSARSLTRVRSQMSILNSQIQAKALELRKSEGNAAAIRDTLAAQLRNSILHAEQMQQVFDKTDAAKAGDPTATERGLMLFNATLKAYQNYLEFLGTEKPLEAEDLPFAIRFIHLKKTLHPERRLRTQLDHAGDCVSRLTEADRRIEGVRDAEILYYYTLARERWDQKALAESVECFVKASELAGMAASTYPRGSVPHLVMLRNEASFLVDASSVYATLGLRDKAIHAASSLCRIRDEIIALGSDDDGDKLLVIEAKLSLAELHLQLQDGNTAALLTEPAIQLANQLRLEKPERCPELDKIFEKHRKLINSSSGI